MGLARATIKLLMRECQREAFSGGVLELGKQDILATPSDLRKWAKEMRFDLKPWVRMELSEKPDMRLLNYISDFPLFKSLGFDHVDSIDDNNYEGCTIVHDMNKEVPPELQGRFDAIYDGGTSEHIFNLPRAFANYAKMLKVSGRIIHSLPSSNYLDHGLYMFTPNLFLEYYSANGWKIESLFLIRQRTSKDDHKWEIYEYEPGGLSRHRIGGVSGMFVIFCVAKKLTASTYDAPVRQGCFEETRKRSASGGETVPEAKAAGRLPKWVKNLLVPIYARIIGLIPLKFFLKLVARY